MTFYSLRAYLGAFNFIQPPKAIFNDGGTVWFMLNDLNKESVTLYFSNGTADTAPMITNFYEADKIIANHGGIIGAIPNGEYSERQIHAIFAGIKEENMNEEAINMTSEQEGSDDMHAKFTPIEAIFAGLGCFGGFKLARGLVKAVITGNGPITTLAMGVIEIAAAIKGAQYGKYVGGGVNAVADGFKNAAKKHKESDGE